MASATVNSASIVSLSDDDNDVHTILKTPTKADLDTEEVGEGVDILNIAGASFLYRIQHFLVITIHLRQITFQAVLDSSMATYDGFIRKQSSLYGHNYPASIRVFE